MLSALLSPAIFHGQAPGARSSTDVSINSYVRDHSPPRLPRQPKHDRNMSSDSSSAATTPQSPPAQLKRACDCCHRRKVKCVGGQPCRNCIAAQLKCTYLAVPQKKGPKGSRAKVISQLRETQELRKTTTGLIATQDSFHDATLLPRELIQLCVDYFFANLYPTQPILHKSQVADAMSRMDADPDAFCLLAAMCSYMMIQPNLHIPSRILTSKAIPDGDTLLKETLRVRKNQNYIESPTVWSVITSFFLFGCYFCLDKHNTAWFFLREATTLAQIIGMHNESNYNSGNFILDSRKRRLYWLLFVTERAYALQQHRPLTLHPTINRPTLDDPSEATELNGFIHLVNLFSPLDDTFVGLWNRSREGCTTEFLAQLQSQLSAALPADLNSTEAQAVDLRCSQQWLRTMVWQLSISQGLLSSTTADKSMSFQYPIEVSRDLVTVTSGFSQSAMEVHGIGLIEKLFDIACTLTDVMACVPIEQPTFENGPSNYLNQLLGLISSLRGGRERYLPLLMTKISDTIPSASTFGYPISSTLPFARVEELHDAHSGSESSLSGHSTPLDSPTSLVGDDFSMAFPEQYMDVTSAPRQISFTAVSNTGLIPYAPLFTQGVAQSAEELLGDASGAFCPGPVNGG